MNASPITWFDDTLLSLRQRIFSTSLHHGLLFSGPDGIGKSEFSHLLAKDLLCHRMDPQQGACGQCQGCMLFQAGSHPDFHVVQSEKQIGIDAIRELSNKLNQTAQIGKNKVCVVLQAETMTEAAANALLKTLEEPTPNTYLLLVSHAQHKLLPTILSRCEKHKLAPPSVEQSMQWLSLSYPQLTLSEPLMALFGRAPVKLKQRIDSDAMPDLAQLQDDLNQVSSGRKTSLALAKQWENDGELLLNWCQRQLKRRFESHLNNMHYPAYKQAIEAGSVLQQPGINKVLVLQSVVEAVALKQEG